MNNNRNQIDSNIQDNIKVIDTSRNTEKETLTGNKSTLDDDDNDDEYNIIALPTESVTDNVPFPENILTTRTPFTTQSPNTSPPSIQVTETFIQSESLNEIIDSDDQSSNIVDVESTTLIDGLNIIESGLSKQSEVSDIAEKEYSIAQPRPFSRTPLSRTKAPIDNDINVSNRETIKSETFRRRPTAASETTKADKIRRRFSSGEDTTLSTTSLSEEDTTKVFKWYEANRRATESTTASDGAETTKRATKWYERTSSIASASTSAVTTLTTSAPGAVETTKRATKWYERSSSPVSASTTAATTLTTSSTGEVETTKRATKWNERTSAESTTPETILNTLVPGDEETTIRATKWYERTSAQSTTSATTLSSSSQAETTRKAARWNERTSSVSSESTTAAPTRRSFSSRGETVTTTSSPETTRRRTTTRDDSSTNATPASDTTKARRRQGQVKFTTPATVETSSKANYATYSYVAGYRGSARFRTSTVRSGQYDTKEDNLAASNYQPLENNRLRALNIENLRQSPSSTSSPTTRSSTTRRSTTPRTRPTTAAPVEVDEETTTEQRIIEAKSRFNLAKGERPDRISFELGIGKKIDLGFTPKAQNKSSDSSKVKVITGPLDKSPIISGREHKQGFVEEIPLLIPTTEGVSVRSFSRKLNLDEIPLNKSDIASFVADEDLRTDSSEYDATTRKTRLRPSIKGFAQRTQTASEATTTESEIEDTSSTVRSRLRPSKTGFVQRITNEENVEQETTEPAPVVDVKVDESTTKRSQLFSYKNRLAQKNGNDENVNLSNEIEESTSARSSFANRFSSRTKLEKSEASIDESTTSSSRQLLKGRYITKAINSVTQQSEVSDESTTSRIRPSGFRSRALNKSRLDVNEESDESKSDESTTSRIRPTFSRSRFTTRSRLDVNQKLDDSKTEESTTSRIRVRPSQGKFLPRPPVVDEIKDVNELQTESPVDETTVAKHRFKFNERKKFNFPSTSAEATTISTDDDLESLNLVTEKSFNDDENEIDSVTSVSDSDDDETTLSSLLDTTTSTIASPVVRIKPIKKLDVFATRQSIVETTAADDSDKDVIQSSTESAKRTRPSRRLVNIRRLKTDDEVLDSQVNEDGSVVAQRRPTGRRLISRTRQRVTSDNKLENGDQDSISEGNDDASIIVPPRPTRKRVTFTRTRPTTTENKDISEDAKKIENGDQESSLSESNDEASNNSSPRPTRKRIVYSRPRPIEKETSEDVKKVENGDLESSISETNDEASNNSSPRPTRKRIVYSRARPSTTENKETSESTIQHENGDEEASLSENNDEASNNSSPRPTRKRIVYSRARPSTTEKIEVIADNSIENEDEESTSERSESAYLPSPRTTRKRVIVTRSRPQKLENTEDGNKIESENQESTAEEGEDGSNVTQSRPTRKRIVFNRTRPQTSNTVVNLEETDKEETVNEEAISQGNEDSSSSTSPRTTRKRVVYRPRPRISENENADDVNQETAVKSVSEDVGEDTNENSGDSIVTRKRIKVFRPSFRTRATTERAVEDGEEDESSNDKSQSTRTRVFKRPLLRLEENLPIAEGDETNEESSSSQPRFGVIKRKLFKVNKKIVNLDDEQQAEVESSSSLPARRTYKVVRTKTPKLLVDRPLVDETSVINTDDENQEIESEKNENEDDQRIGNDNNEDIEEENVNVESEASSRPILRFPTRPSSVDRLVTIKRRPAFNLNAKTSTVHPASTKFSKDALPTRARQVTVRRKFKPTVASSESTVDEIEPEKKVALGERNKKIFSKGYRKSLSTTSAPNITPLTIDTTDIETTDFEDVVETTEIPLDNNDETILQKETSPAKPRFSLSRFTTTTIKPTTLHHVFAIDVEEEENASKNNTKIKENNADEVIKKLQKLIEINRIVEVNSKNEKFKLLKNKKLKSIKLSDLTVEKPPVLESFGEISRQTIIKLVKRNSTVENVTDLPALNETRSPKNVVFAETVFSQPESSTISLEGLFDREKKSQDIEPEKESSPTSDTNDIKVIPLETLIGAPAPLLRPESNETNPIIISLKSLDKVILSKVGKTEIEREENLTTESPPEETTSVVDN